MEQKEKDKIAELRELNKTILKRFEMKIADNMKLRNENDQLKEEIKKLKPMFEKQDDKKTT
jgi:cell division protein FtsB|tara:strand:+ start:428 stop:610 length:183 start_codon:yes stop_codon:yes gene_type:complete